MVCVSGKRAAWSLSALALAIGGQALPAYAQTENAQDNAAKFDIRAFQVRGNTVLPPEVVERAVYPFMGPGRTEADVEAARAALQKAFEDAGYIAVSVTLPEQGVETGILQLAVQQQAVGQVLVEGSKRPEAVRAQAPSLVEGQTPSLPAFQRDVVAMNQSSSQRVTPELRAGVAPGTLDVVLKVEESSPLHASAEINNFSSAATSDLRVSGMLRHDNLWGLGHSLSVSSQLTPRRIDDGVVLSANYLAPIAPGTQLLGYYVHSDSDIAVVGGTSVVGRGNIGGIRLIQSLGSSDGFYHSLTVGLDYKDFGEDLKLGADTDSAPIRYVPATVSWRGDWTGDGRKTDLGLTTILGIRGLGDDKAAFEYKRFRARDGFFILKLDAGHNQDIFGGVQIDARLSGQWSPDPLISNEGFSLGGMQSVRGYYESEYLADYGFAYQLELRTPEMAGMLAGPTQQFRLHSFWDMGWGRIHHPTRGQDARFRLMSVGVGARLRLFNILNGAVDLGTPLLSGPDSKSGTLFTRFRIWGEF